MQLADDHPDPSRRWRVGEVTVTKIHEITRTSPLSVFFWKPDLDAFEPHRSWAVPLYVDDDDRVVISVHALVVESAGTTIVVDTCAGNDHPVPFDDWNELSTDFLSRFGTAGFDPVAVDVVACTHLHFDHVGWNTRLVDGRWVPTFPNARYLFGRSEYEYWAAHPDGPVDIAGTATFDDTVTPIIDAGLAELVEPGHRITDEVSFVSSPGHSPGHHSILIESAGERAVITGDAMHSPLQIHFPEWYVATDADHAAARATRGQLRSDWLDGRLVVGTHFPGLSAGRVTCDDAGEWGFEPDGGVEIS